MKILSLTLLLLFSASLQAAPFFAFGNELEIDGNTLQIDNQCRLKVTDKDGNVRLIKLNMPKSPACQFLLFEASNVIQFERVGASYMFFIEEQIGSGNECQSRHVAVALKMDGTITTSKEYGSSGACPAALEIHDATAFARGMKILR